MVILAMTAMHLFVPLSGNRMRQLVFGRLSGNTDVGIVGDMPDWDIVWSESYPRWEKLW